MTQPFPLPPFLSTYIERRQRVSAGQFMRIDQAEEIARLFRAENRYSLHRFGYNDFKLVIEIEDSEADIVINRGDYVYLGEDGAPRHRAQSEFAAQWERDHNGIPTIGTGGTIPNSGILYNPPYSTGADK